MAKATVLSSGHVWFPREVCFLGSWSYRPTLSLETGTSLSTCWTKCSPKGSRWQSMSCPSLRSPLMYLNMPLSKTPKFSPPSGPSKCCVIKHYYRVIGQASGTLPPPL